MRGPLSLTTALMLGLTPLGPVTRTADGPPVRRYVKPIICLGTFVHPIKKWQLDVTDQRMDNWVNTFEAMKANGVPIKLTRDHKRNAAEAVLGDVRELTRSGDWLNAVVEVTGEKNIALVEANKDVSVEIDPELTDGTGKKYAECITAVSVVQNPIVPGQSGFQRIAAGLDDDRPTYLFSTGEPVMKKLFAAVAAVAGLVGMSLSADAVTEDTGAEVLGKVKGKLEGLEADKSDLTKKLSLAGEDRKPDTKYLSLAAKSMEKEIDGLKGILSDAGVTALKNELIGDRSKKEFSTLLLSADDEEQGVALVERLVKIIRESPAVRKGAQTQLQNTVALSREVPDDAAPTNTPPTPERLAEILGTTNTGRSILESAKK